MAREIFRRKNGSGGVAVSARADERYESSCFADEVVIDFPSPARAIDHIRRTFVVEERTEAIPADLHLSWRDARDGAVVPLDVPVRLTCRSCGGRGETWSERCPRCAGAGVELLRHRVQVSVPAGVSDGARFCFSIGARHDPPTRIELRVLVA